MTSRNDPCPCGSGKKYKKCCQQAKDQLDFEYRRQQNAEAALVPVLFEMVTSVLDPSAIQDAWIEFNGDDEAEPFEQDDPMAMVFMPWFFYSWSFDPKAYLPEDDEDDSSDEAEEGEVTIGLIHLAFLHDELPEDQREFLMAANVATYTICEVLEVRPGAGMRIRDLFCEREFDVTERTASQSLRRGELIYCAPITIGGLVSLLTVSPYALRPTNKLAVFNLRKLIRAEMDQQTLGDDQLFEYETPIRYLYLELLDGSFAPPQIVGEDGKAIEPVTVYFQVDSSDEAFHKLKDLAGEHLKETLVKEATIKRKKVVEVAIPWLEAQEDDTSRLCGVVRIKDDKLVAQVYSLERAEQIKGIIEDRLGKRARYLTTDTSPLDELDEDDMDSSEFDLQGAITNKDNVLEFPVSSSDPFSVDRDSPEVQEVLKEVAAEHWSKWYDVKVPALDNKTPREAALTPEGRDLLESLLLEYEIRSAEDPTNNTGPDIATFRRELGMN